MADKFLQLHDAIFAIESTTTALWLFLEMCVDSILSEDDSSKSIVDFPIFVENYYSAASHKEIDLCFEVVRFASHIWIQML